MRIYRIIVSRDAADDLERFVDYLLYEKKSVQAASNLLDDYELTLDILEKSAGSIRLCENPRLRERGYRRVQFLRHSYFMLYRVEGDAAIIDAVGHDLQDIDGLLR